MCGHCKRSQVLKARPELVSQACLLFPTVSDMATTTNGRRLAPLFSSLVIPPVAMSTSLLSWVPQRILRPIVASLAGQTAGSDGANTTSNLVASPGTVTAALGMAAEEMRRVKELDSTTLRQYGDRLWWYWAEGETDGWVQGKSITEIERVLDEAGHDANQRTRCSDGMKHAFCLRDGEFLALLLRRSRDAQSLLDSSCRSRWTVGGKGVSLDR